MSRQLRKLFGKPSLPDYGSDDEYEPPNTYNQKQNLFADLDISTSDSDKNAELVEEISDQEQEVIKEVKKKKNGKKKQKNGTKGKNCLVDEVEQSVQEVNAILGEPSVNVVQKDDGGPSQQKKVFGVKLMHLNASNELKRKFGPEEDEGTKRTKQPRYVRTTSIISHNYNFKRNGLSMSIQHSEGGLTYFAIDHNHEYQRMHGDLLLYLSESQQYEFDARVPDSLLHSMHIEGLLVYVEILCEMEEYTAVLNTIERIIAYVQYIAHPSFILSNMQTRLEYKYVENRPFHIAVLKYIHLLSNKACHRTALELSKMLLNLDPSDPLAVVFVIDTFAIRAREHEWLIEAIDFMDIEKKVKYMFNMQFSYAMAHFHVAVKKKEDLSNADELIKKAMINYPSMLMAILSYMRHTPPERLRQHDFFNKYAQDTTCKLMQELVVLYAAFTGARWREPPVLEWLLRNAHELIDLYDADPTVKENADNMRYMRRSLFKGWPTAIYRHLCVIKSLSGLIVNKAVPDLAQYTLSQCFDPAPPTDSVSRHRDATANAAQRTSLFNEFLRSINPNFNAQLPPGVNIEPLPNFRQPGDDRNSDENSEPEDLF